MFLSGVDVSTFAPHSTRGASISEATRRGASPAQIVAHGNWSSLGTYQRFYNREVHDTPVGRLVLQASLCKCSFPFPAFPYWFLFSPWVFSFPWVTPSFPSHFYFTFVASLHILIFAIMFLFAYFDILHILICIMVYFIKLLVFYEECWGLWSYLILASPSAPLFSGSVLLSMSL